MARDLIKSDLTIKASQPKDKPYRLNDGKGLVLLINPNGSKYWRLNYAFFGKRKTLSLGTYPAISLKTARLKAMECRQQILEGIDPSQARQERKQQIKQSFEDEQRQADGIPLENSFADIAQRWLEDFKPTVVPATFSRSSRRIEMHVLPYLGNKPIADIRAPDLLEVVLPIAKRQTVETAHRVLNLCHRIFKYAVAHGLMEYDPSPAVADALPSNKIKHRAAITDPRQVGQLMRDIDKYTGTFVVQCALKLSPLIFARPGEIRQMEWKEIDLDAKEWRYFVTKTSTEHIVPLSRQAVEVLQSIRKLTGQGRYVFPSARSDKQPMSNNTVRLAIRTMGYDADTMSAHGFRTTASTLLNEQGWSADAIERQLAHSPRNKVRAAYNRAQYLDERRRMMQAWADYLDGLKNGAEVIPIRKQV
ncbi:tyrosine-type recombinase/integrase [Methylomarinum sp. Ch1-1]|uniref:Tyrosine-type recombinase/integrase n=1 Tax=Methylomarinum roseum TaxID=3067653 RepID=A0AAU7NP97_9GAMM|nr:tyrosine-type recombinase/integrase [Methylomarinum sp. Ch1-1]MDP4521328.1 tyrosine-type recombinase/integrase [Methylomarinum sp. Ch1-1]